jgi:Mg/Co/Ni transporter MgtE
VRRWPAVVWKECAAGLAKDPATAPSIILTTVTEVAEVVGFFSFLGIATLLAGTLEAVPG